MGLSQLPEPFQFIFCKFQVPKADQVRSDRPAPDRKAACQKIISSFPDRSSPAALNLTMADFIFPCSISFSPSSDSS